MERVLGLSNGAMLETPWQDLDGKLQELWLWGAGDRHITFTWKGGASPIKYGGHFEGIIPGLLSKYRQAKSGMKIRQLEKYMRSMNCPACKGERLNPQARAVKLATAHPKFEGHPLKSLPEVCHLSVAEASEFFRELNLDSLRAVIAEEVLKEIRGRLGFLLNVGLDYLTLDRTAPTLSGGESQRIRLAGQIGSGLVGVLYILDEPSIGLHPRDNDRLLSTLARLRDMGNTVVVVEHDEDTMRAADHIIDFGPGAGVRGGYVVAEGSASQVARKKESVTGQFLAGKRKIETPSQRRPRTDKSLKIVGARHNNLKNVDVEIPLGLFVCVTGVSGSGKSSLVNDILVEALRRDLNGGEGEPGLHDRLEGLERLDKLIAIDQSPIGRTPRSNPGTYIKVFDDIRNLFTQLPEAKRKGYKPGRFSFNVQGGRCEACEGNGSNRLEMDFLADVWVTCPVCEGHRFNRETLQVRFKGKSISDVLELDVQEALELFQNQPNIRHKLQTLHDVGLDYIKIGQPSPTLSGGEAQRVKLARELVKKSTGQTLYLLDEPTTGLHFADIELLLKVLHDFANAGNTVLVVEHNLDVIKTADWIIDLGPEGGDAGGQIIAVGTPEELAQRKDSHTGQALARLFEHERLKKNGVKKPAKSGVRRKKAPVTLATKISVQGARQHNLKDVSVEVARDKMTIFCGPSGSGKSSLAMDTIYAEGQRRYVESLSSYARQFVSQMQKPQVEHIDGLSPAIAIEQKNLGHTPRSTVGTVTEVYDYLRILLARLGKPYCPDCDRAIGTQTSDEIVDKILAEPEGTKLYLMAPMEVEVGRQYESLWEEIRGAGYVRVRIDGQTHSLDNPPKIDRRRKHRVEVVIDRIVVRPDGRSRIAESVENALALGKGVMTVAWPQDDVPESRWQVVVHSQHLACDQCGRSFEPLTPHNFSFNSALGWCPACEGLGVQTGANPAALLRDPKLTLAEGAVDLWPRLENPVSRWMLEALATGTGLPLHVPFEQLSSRQRRILMHGAGEQWFDVIPDGERYKVAGTLRVPSAASAKKSGKEADGTRSVPATMRPLFRFQFKGLYPALEEASKLSPTLRSRLEHLVDQVECSTCGGSRLRDDAAAVRFRGKTIDDVSRFPLGELQAEVEQWNLSEREQKIAGELVREVSSRVQFLNDVGLSYLTLSRTAASLSNGEAQRIRLASQLGSGLCGVLYVLDEPTIGLHPRDNTRLLKALHKLRDLGNTLVVVEHDQEVIEGADYLCDFGPGAGRLGGRIVAEGPPKKILRNKESITGPYLNGKKRIPVLTNRRMAPLETVNKREAKKPGSAAPGEGWLEIVGGRQNNLRDVSVRIPLGTLTAVTGPSGSGKSSLIDDILYRSLARTLHRAATLPGAHDEIRGLEHINKVIQVDQQPLGNSPSSNPATYTGVFELIRLLFAQLPEAKVRGYSPRRFSFNVPGGRCEACEGMGQKCIEMHFLPDVWVECDACNGKRYNEETLAVRYKGRSIADVLEMTCGDAVELFKNIPKIRRILQTLCDVGLDYLTLGQAAPTLSGGEAQRVKLAAELSRPDTGRTLYLLDEPTTGLHFEDLRKLLDVLHRLVDLGNTVVVIEHNVDVIKQADWILDMGPEAGEAGGLLVAEGTPEDIVAHAKQALLETEQAASGRREPADGAALKRDLEDQSARNGSGGLRPPLALRSHTGEALAPVLEAGPHQKRQLHDFAAAEEKQEDDLDITEVGRDVKMPWEVDGRRWHTHDRVDRKGQPVKWDGRILERVVDRIHQLAQFSPTDWNNRSVVEIAALTKADGWFFHAITAETWLLKMKFRVARNTFKREQLHSAMPLKTLNQMHDIQAYSNEPRVKCKNLRGPWQEVQIQAHTLDEVDTPAFWTFLERAVGAFGKIADREETKIEDHMPWKKLGRIWHLSRKGFPPGRTVKWDTEVLEELLEMLSEISPEGQFLWNNQQLVHFIPQGRREPWASIQTKKPECVNLVLAGPKGRTALGRITDLGFDRDLDASREDRDLAKVRFRTLNDLRRGDLRDFLKEHLAGLNGQ
jgi:excinuclease ABC subunit A